MRYEREGGTCNGYLEKVFGDSSETHLTHMIHFHIRLALLNVQNVVKKGLILYHVGCIIGHTHTHADSHDQRGGHMTRQSLYSRRIC